MTDHDRLLSVPDDDALDAAASAVVDGVATPEQEAAVAAAPDGADRVAAHRAVAGAVGTPVGAQRPEAAAGGLAAALAAFGEETHHVDRPRAPITPMPLPPPPSSRRGLPRLAAVAAALLLLVGLGTFAVALLGSDGADENTTFSAAPPAKDAADSATGALDSTPSLGAGPASPQPSIAAPAAAQPTGPARTTTEALAQVPGPPQVINGGDLGAQVDAEAVAQRASMALQGTPTVAASPGDPALPREVQTCVTTGTAGVNFGPLRYRATGTFEGTPALFLVFDRPSASPPFELLVLARDGCSTLATSHF